MTGTTPSGWSASREQPWIGALGIGRRQRILKREPTLREEAVPWRQESADCAAYTNSDSSHRRREADGTASIVDASRSNRLSASRPSRVFGSWITGNNVSMLKAYPPSPDRRSPGSTRPSRRKASTEISTNVADAITAIDNTLRPGRWCVFRSPIRETAHQP